jgi:hypothetical protein
MDTPIAVRGVKGLALGLVTLAMWGCAESVDERTRAARAVRVTKLPEDVRGCALRGLVKDDDWRDVLKKVAQLDGDTAYIVPDQPTTVEAYRCTK